MQGEPFPIDAQALLAQAVWVRRLAKKLVRDGAVAEDLVQDTWLAALEGAPSEEGRLRPWLARVLRNFARQTQRGEANRARREEASARPERSPSASETAERLEAQRVLVEALEALAEPYRTTVTLRYLDGLSAAQIGRRQGIPAGTVRWRLKQGMDELRARLDKRFEGERRAWCVALLPLLRRPPLAEIAAGSLSAVVKGVMAMNAVTKVGIAAAVVLTASVGVWVAVERPEEVQAPVAVDAQAPQAPALAPPAVDDPVRELAPGPAAELRESVAPAEPPRGGLVAAAAPSRARLEVRFVDGADHPVADVHLALTNLSAIAPAISGPDGRAAVDVDPLQDSLSIEIEASRPAFATYFGKVTLDRGRTTWLGDVRLEPGGAVAGWVLGPDGAPARGAEVKVTSPEMLRGVEEARRIGPWASTTSTGWPIGKAQADGSFRIDGVRAGLARVWAGSDDTRWSFSEPVEVPVASVRAGIELRLAALEKEDTIAGVVVSPQEKPVPDAEVRYTSRNAVGTWSGSFSAGEDGGFVHRVQVRGPHDFVAHDREGRWPDVSATAVQPGTRDLVLQFPLERWIEVTVHERSGGKIEEYSAALLSSDGSRILRAGKLEVHARGLATLSVPGETFVVEVRARGHGSAVLGPWTPESAPSSASCDLERRPGVRGRVRGGGRAVPGASVALHEMAGPDTSIERNGFPTRLHPQAEDSTPCDEQGFFELDPSRPGSGEGNRFYQRDPKAPGTFAILCDADGWALAEVSPLEINPAKGMDGIEIELVRGGAIEGHVRKAPGKDPAGVIVAIDRGDCKPRTQRVGPDGAFRFDHLTPGRFNVTRSEVEVRGNSWSTSWSKGDDVHPKYPWNCSVQDGSVTRFDLDLSDERPCALLAQVSANGVPASGWTATLWPESRSTTKKLPGGAVDAEGRLRLEVSEPGPWRLLLGPPAESGAGASFEVPVELSRGEIRFPLDLRVGSVRGHCAGPRGESSISFSGGQRGSVTCRSEVRLDAQGRFEMPFVLAGHGRVGRLQILAEGGTSGPDTEVPVDVPAGGSVEVEVP
jgi:RNA polymerase sigma-70 factor (ECF subfamily)